MHLDRSASPRSGLSWHELSGTDRAQTDATRLIILPTHSEPTSEPFCPGWPSAEKPPHRPVWRCSRPGRGWIDWTSCAEIRTPRTPRTSDELGRLPKNSDRVELGPDEALHGRIGRIGRIGRNDRQGHSRTADRRVRSAKTSQEICPVTSGQSHPAKPLSLVFCDVLDSPSEASDGPCSRPTTDCKYVSIRTSDVRRTRKLTSLPVPRGFHDDGAQVADVP